jgi:hypothetical protein
MARKNLKGMNTDFIGLCESRLKELETRRTPKWFKENKLLIEKLVPLWGKKKEVTRQDVEDFINETAKTSRPTPTHTVENAKSFIRHGLEREMWNADRLTRLKVSVGKTESIFPPLKMLEQS